MQCVRSGSVRVHARADQRVVHGTVSRRRVRQQHGSGHGGVQRSVLGGVRVCGRVGVGDSFRVSCGEVCPLRVRVVLDLSRGDVWGCGQSLCSVPRGWQVRFLVCLICITCMLVMLVMLPKGERRLVRATCAMPSCAH